MKKLKAFTLIETLIVIIVFCIGILAVLHGLSQTLRNKDYADIQIKSAFFAREGIELMFNLRDANYHKELPRNCIFQGSKHISADGCEENFTPGTVLKIGIGTGNEYIYVTTGTLNDDFDKDFENFQIYIHTGNVLNNSVGYLYNHTGTKDEKTRFARYLVITGVVADGKINPDNLLKVESHVLYKKGYLTGEKVMETFIGNYEFENRLF